MQDINKSILLASTFFILTPLALFISAFSLLGLTKSEVSAKPVLAGSNIYASLPENAPSIEVSIKSTDARVEIVRQYLARYKSPLADHAEHMVNVADETGLDFRLLAAIAQQESNLCKFAPEGTYNCWGWGIHKRGTLGFDSYEHGIGVVSRGIKDNYIDQGYVTVEDIMRKYTPSSNGSWANGVTQFMADMQ